MPTAPKGGRLFRTMGVGEYPDLNTRKRIPTPVALYVSSIPDDHTIYRTVFPATGLLQDLTLEVEALHEEPVQAEIEMIGDGVSVTSKFPLKKGLNFIELPPRISKNDKMLIRIEGVATGFWLSYIYDMD